MANYDKNQLTDKGERYYDIVKSRYNSNKSQLLKRGYNYADINKLAKIMTYQNILEGGWVLNRADNNYGGMRYTDPITKKSSSISFKDLNSYYDNWFDMMNDRWPGWDKAKDYVDYANIINHDDLGLKTTEEIQAYRNRYAKEHNGKQIYWYAPQYENNNKHYRDHLAKVVDRTNFYIDLIDAENEGWNTPSNNNPFFKGRFVPFKRDGGILKRIEQHKRPINITSLKYNISTSSPKIPDSYKVSDPLSQTENNQVVHNPYINKAAEKHSEGCFKRIEIGKSGIRIKEKNEGKFTDSAKRAGMGVQEYAHKVMNDPDATPLQKKRANFAIQAKKWNK